MRDRFSRVRQPVPAETAARGSAQLVVIAGLLLVVASAAFRAWALYPSWFYADDYVLLVDAQGRDLDLDYLSEPFNSHLMPGGRLLAWMVAHSGRLDWGLAATFTWGAHVLAGLAALWMLVRLFGPRWGVLGPLVLYLFSAMTVPAMMWWTASINQVPLQAPFFMAVGCWVAYLRQGRLRWLIGTLLAVAVGLFFYVKALLLGPVLAFLMLAYFTSGPVRRRLSVVARRYWPAVVLGTALAGGYAAYYSARVAEPFTRTTADLVEAIADKMLATAFVTGAVGGPWEWRSPKPPNALADPPDVLVHLAWVVFALVVVYSLLRRQGAGRAWVLLGLYLLMCFALLVTSRAPAFGSDLGLEYRYLTDAACVLALCTGLAFMELPGAEAGSVPRPQPLLTFGVGVPVALLFAFAVAVSSTASAVRYVGNWHTANASDVYFHNLMRDMDNAGVVAVADTQVPGNVIDPLLVEHRSLSKITPLVTHDARFPKVSPELSVVARDGTLHEAVIASSVVSKPGPRPGCGWLVSDRGRRVPLSTRAIANSWWLRIGYLASTATPVSLRIGGTTVEGRLEAGVNSLYAQVDGSFDTVVIGGIASGAVVCVDSIEVGTPIPGQRWQ